MASALFWCLLVAGVGSSVAAPDFYSAWCPCKLKQECPVPYGSFFDDIAIFGVIPPCKKFGFVRCCSASDIPEGFDLERPAVYLPRPVAEPEDQQNLLISAAALPSAARSLDLQDVQQRQDVIDFKAAQEKLKRDIANGIDNPNPPCGCYTSGTCPTRYATPSTGRDIGCLPGYDTCCFLDDPWPNYQVTNLTINAPCSVKEACERFFGLSPFDISSFGPLEPCYLGQNRCLDYLQEGSNVPPSFLPGPTTKRPTTSRRTTITRRPVTTQRPVPTYDPTTPRSFITRRPVTTQRPVPTYDPTTPRPFITRRPFTTQRPVTTYDTTTQRSFITRRPFTTYDTTTARPETTFRTASRRPPTTPYFFTTTQGPEPEPPGEGSNIFINNAYLPPSQDFGSAAERAVPSGLQFQLPTF